MNTFMKYIMVLLGLLLTLNVFPQDINTTEVASKTDENLPNKEKTTKAKAEKEQQNKTSKTKKGDKGKSDKSEEVPKNDNCVQKEAVGKLNQVEGVQKNTDSGVQKEVSEKTDKAEDAKKEVVIPETDDGKRKEVASKTGEQNKPMKIDNSQKKNDEKNKTGKGGNGKKIDPAPRPNPPVVDRSIPTKRVINDFKESSPFVTQENVTSISDVITKHLENLQLTSIDKNAYIKERNLTQFVERQCDTIRLMCEDQDAIIDGFLRRYANQELKSETDCRNQIAAILSEQASVRDSLVAPLKNEVEKAIGREINTKQEEFDTDWKLIGVCVAVVLICIVLLLWYLNVKKRQQAPSTKKVSPSMHETGRPSLIVVGQKATPAMRKQSLEDVYDNEAYRKIDSLDFCTDSAVRSLYIKNTCVKDIYNMYAEDLKHPGNPGEDGCMVLGRWVYDEGMQQYDVSLEYIVRPGDDAVFSEYELNFGGKIQLQMSENLRKLRREKDLQYDLTCWVHSHPGLGVFFSNSDNNVHTQLKSASHPKFLTALVIDIMTPKQETGIFTFKQDETINSKNDITKMYSLEEWYQWALASERKSFDANDYFDALGKVKDHVNECYGIQLSNGAIIDMTFLAAKTNGFIGFVQGFTLERGEKTQCITSAVTKNETMTDNEMIGCFLVASHCSIPSIRKAVAKYIRNIRFVLVYTAADGLLTSIPVVNQDLSTSDAYYGEQTLEDLKIWTRRRR